MKVSPARVEGKIRAIVEEQKIPLVDEVHQRNNSPESAGSTSPNSSATIQANLSGFRRREEESLEILPPMIASPTTIDAPYL